MSDWHNERIEFQPYIEQAQAARAEAVERVGYLAIAGAGRLVGTAIGATRAALGALGAWRDRRAAVREILRLDDRMLQDIGLTRADAWAAVDGTLGNRAQDWPLEPAAYTDIALSGYAAAGCNDNGERRRAA